MKKFVVIVVIPILLFGGGLLFLSLKKDNPTQPAIPTSQQNTAQQNQSGPFSEQDAVTWEFTGEEWRAKGTPPACPNPLVLGTPVDIDYVTALLYPGQTRNNQYKPHGGFAFNSNTNKVTVKTPLEGHLVKASRYKEQGETQYLLVFINECGIMYRFDHLLELAPKYQEIVRKLPEPKVNDSRTTPINPPVYALGGEVVGTKVGFENNRNVSVDFGVYDLRKKNGITKLNDKENAPYGICWLNYFSPYAASVLKELPARDQASGKTSDYCK